MHDTQTPHDDRRSNLPDDMPVIAVKNAVVFPIPSLPIPLSVGRRQTLLALEQAQLESDHVLVVSQRDPEEDEPEIDGLYSFGTIARILRLTAGSDDTHDLLLEGITRARVVEYREVDGHLRASLEPVFDDADPKDPETEAMIRTMKEMVGRVIHLSPRIPDEALNVVEGIEDPAHLADLVITQMRLSQEEKQNLLEETSVNARLGSLLILLAREAEVLEISGRIRSEVRDSLDKHQREVYLREQLKAIRKELGEEFGDDDDLDELAARIHDAQMPEAPLKAAKKALRRLGRMNPQSAEASVARTYLDWLLDMPWAETTTDTIDIREARATLDADHHGLDKVKRRIVEFLAVRKLKGDLKGPILCLVGPPGVGKTSLGKSVAEALGRTFVRISLGGVKDESEIRGHRRTYIGALPGRIVKGLKKAGTMNPVFVLDEIDKLGNDFRGDPASALLEVLDPEQNDTFSDHYLEVPVDLSQVLFLTTANRADTIPAPLLDRMELIELPGYIEDEKVAIAEAHLLRRQIEDHGLEQDQVVFPTEAIRSVVSQYTREAGVRGLNRQIAGVLRTVARDVATEDVDLPITVDNARIRHALGPQRYFPESAEEVTTPGTAVGLAWTPVGGDILIIEATAMVGSGKLTLTGKLGEVMQESAQATLSYVHARADLLGIDEALFKDRNIHVHVPSGAIPKDGPSAGVTMLVALVSLLTGTKGRPDLAMTGEITLRGVVLPVGGIKEKVIAAARAGMTEIILPKRNAGDLEEIPSNIRDLITFHPVERMEEVLKIALGIDMSARSSVVPPKKASPRKTKKTSPRAQA